jgi:hypothetical protein
MIDFGSFLKNGLHAMLFFALLLPLQIVSGIIFFTLIITIYTIPYYSRYAYAYIVNTLNKVFPFIPAIAYPEIPTC